MATIRKVAPEIAATWDLPADREPIPVPADRRGLTRMDYSASGSFGWMARVYHGNVTFTRYFADARYGGPSGALRRAEIWRDELRQRVAARSTPRPDRVRLVRTDRPQQKLVGWYAYVGASGRRLRRYFSDARYGGSSAARAVAEQWAAATLAGS
jgi:hypothetical protein